MPVPYPVPSPPLLLPCRPASHALRASSVYHTQPRQYPLLPTKYAIFASAITCPYRHYRPHRRMPDASPFPLVRQQTAVPRYPVSHWYTVASCPQRPSRAVWTRRTILYRSHFTRRVRHRYSISPLACFLSGRKATPCHTEYSPRTRFQLPLILITPYPHPVLPTVRTLEQTLFSPVTLTAPD